MPKRAVVLAGGGARGPYQVGVWQAIREAGIEYHIVTGTSVGALNAAIMVQGDFELAKTMWETISRYDVMREPRDFSTTQKLFMASFQKMVERGGMDVSPLEDLLRRTLDEEKFRLSPVEFGLVTVRYPAIHAVTLLKDQIPRGKLVDYLLASAAYFPLFPAREIDGEQYIDGAYSDNMPARLALECGAEEIVAVDLDSYGIVRRLRTDVPVTYVRCHWDLGAIMNFDARSAKRSIQLGYLDGMKAFQKLEGSFYAFAPGESRRNALWLSPALEDIRRQTGVHFLKEYEKIARSQDSASYKRGFYPLSQRSYTLGRAITAAAEITGELLGLLPDEAYTLQRFNRLILERAGVLYAPSPYQGPDRRKEPLHHLFSVPRTAKSHLALHTMYRQLEGAYFTGAPPSSLWGMAAVSPREFAAANYILALQLRQGDGLRR